MDDPVDQKTTQVPSAPLSNVPLSSEHLPEWRSCCFRLQPQLATFTVQVLFSAFLVLFAAYKLQQNTGTADPLWVSILTTTVGVWLPSPLHISPTSSTAPLSSWAANVSPALPFACACAWRNLAKFGVQRPWLLWVACPLRNDYIRALQWDSARCTWSNLVEVVESDSSWREKWH